LQTSKKKVPVTVSLFFCDPHLNNNAEHTNIYLNILVQIPINGNKLYVILCEEPKGQYLFVLPEDAVSTTGFNYCQMEWRGDFWWNENYRKGSGCGLVKALSQHLWGEMWKTTKNLVTF